MTLSAAAVRAVEVDRRRHGIATGVRFADSESSTPTIHIAGREMLDTRWSRRTTYWRVDCDSSTLPTPDSSRPQYYECSAGGIWHDGTRRSATGTSEIPERSMANRHEPASVDRSARCGACRQRTTPMPGGVS